MMKNLVLIFALCFPLFMEAQDLPCNILPSTRVFPELNIFSVQEDVEFGEKKFEELEKEASGLFKPQHKKFSEDTAVTNYLNEFLQELLAFAPDYALVFEYEVFVSGSAERNARALPGGKIIATLGLIAEAESEDMLATTLAHEIGHIALRHISRRRTLEYFVSLEKALVSEAIEKYTSSDEESADEELRKLGFLYSEIHRRSMREFYDAEASELEADIFSANLLRKGGFNPTSKIQSYKDQIGKEFLEFWGVSFHPPSFIRALVWECSCKGLDLLPERESEAFIRARKQARKLLKKKKDE